jgi:hypothetical protein
VVDTLCSRSFQKRNARKGDVSDDEESEQEESDSEEGSEDDSEEGSESDESEDGSFYTRVCISH